MENENWVRIIGALPIIALLVGAVVAIRAGRKKPPRE